MSILWVYECVIIIFKGLVDLINETDISMVCRSIFLESKRFEYNNVS